ncbi:hypothetical protein VPH35_122467 [Triticum aestivum]|uniref:Uncharacterized protein n=1 Tax=Triticum turgidum subsp. durum TaxID=4567 RepID=A0A9R0RZM3_TRITD|nr:unnamed protein product [Triticum turgidum subsp. durum]VAH68820.1 unnamed protein product [Triticum turgidum subsp. durum]VAI27446.1 unnamed protein product [Triticum turgidum subsp. durum]VAI33983.1 unnamed protein product [Triticum turgidum subsp. durum]VAI34835.1 unnamed protein product [Triticum turgidum subsp. durum]
MVQYVDLLIAESTYSMVQIKMTQSSVYLHDTIYMVHTVSIYCLCTVCLLHVQIKMCLHIFFSHKQILDVRLALAGPYSFLAIHLCICSACLEGFECFACLSAYLEYRDDCGCTPYM